jgi:hypothetical protein
MLFVVLPVHVLDRLIRMTYKLGCFFFVVNFTEHFLSFFPARSEENISLQLRGDVLSLLNFTKRFYDMIVMHGENE